MDNSDEGSIERLLNDRYYITDLAYITTDYSARDEYKFEEARKRINEFTPFELIQIMIMIQSDTQSKITKVSDELDQLTNEIERAERWK